MDDYEFRSADICRRLLSARARNITFSTAPKSALVVAPHPDDETFGCGSTIARKTAAGSRVSVCVVSEGDAFPSDEMSPEEIVAMRRTNFGEACNVLGIRADDVWRLEFPDRGLTDNVAGIAGAISDVIERVQPDEVFLPTRHDLHPDHKAVNRAVFDAVDRSGTRAALYAYPVWFWSRDTWTPPHASRAAELASRLRLLAAGLTLRAARVDAGPFFESKRRAMACYEWELAPDRAFFEQWSLRTEELFFAAGPATRNRP
ncbi:MAG TPA: PIG-L family deacetylase [Acidimicrobiia bacterium]|nr:PIG-L family deacetylase [Acidimicrobiia bacterium]